MQTSLCWTAPSTALAWARAIEGFSCTCASSLRFTYMCAFAASSDGHLHTYLPSKAPPVLPAFVADCLCPRIVLLLTCSAVVAMQEGDTSGFVSQAARPTFDPAMCFMLGTNLDFSLHSFGFLWLYITSARGGRMSQTSQATSLQVEVQP